MVSPVKPSEENAGCPSFAGFAKGGTRDPCDASIRVLRSLFLCHSERVRVSLTRTTRNLLLCLDTDGHRSSFSSANVRVNRTLPRICRSRA